MNTPVSQSLEGKVFLKTFIGKKNYKKHNNNNVKIDQHR